MNPTRLVRSAILFALAVLLLSAGMTADNVIQIENSKTGTTAWQVTNPTVNKEVEGYASLTSVNRGGQISFFVNAKEASYTIEVLSLIHI